MSAFTRLEVEALTKKLASWVGSDGQQPVHQAATLLLLGVNRRKHLDDMTRLMQLPKETVRYYLANARRMGIWRGESKVTYANWQVRPLEFLLDAMTVAGIIERVQLHRSSR